VTRIVRSAALLAVLGLAATRLPAQSKPPSPWDDQIARPTLPSADADTNEASAYFVLGTMHRRSDPANAARALWWASRLDPSDPAPLALRAMLFFQEHRGLERKLRRGKAKPHEIAAAERFDSLANLSMLLDPFILYQPGIQSLPLPPLELTERELKRHPDAVGLRVLRAGILHRRGSLDSALVELRAGRASIRKLNDSTSMPIYASTAMFDYAIGRMLWTMGQADSARVAFESALAEDLSFFMAHAHLGALALQTGDTARAVEEYARAVDVAPGMGWLRYDYGTALLKTGRFAEAIEQLQRAVELEPHYATAYYNLAIAHELAGRPADAYRSFSLFLVRAPRRMRDEIAVAEERLDALFPTVATPAP
jgi:tetratricopeptide (TPR) repeat protein